MDVLRQRKVSLQVESMDSWIDRYGKFNTDLIAFSMNSAVISTLTLHVCNPCCRSDLFFSASQRHTSYSTVP